MKSLKAKSLALLSTVAASGQALALDAATNTAITDAGTAGSTSVGLAATALITIIVAMVGVGIVVALMKRT